MQFKRKKDKKLYGLEEKPEASLEIFQPVGMDEMVEDHLFRTRRIMIVGEIDDLMSTFICTHLQMLSTFDNPLYIYINSPGGCVSSGYAIIDQMLSCKCPVYTIVTGQAHSMGAIIAAFGKKGHRYATPNASMMLHSMVIQSPQNDIESHMKMTHFAYQDYLAKMLNLSKRLTITKDQLLSLMDESEWMSPKRAIDIGLIDAIWTPRMEQSLNRRSK